MIGSGCDRNGEGRDGCGRKDCPKCYGVEFCGEIGPVGWPCMAEKGHYPRSKHWASRASEPTEIRIKDWP